MKINFHIIGIKISNCFSQLPIRLKFMMYLLALKEFMDHGDYKDVSFKYYQEVADSINWSHHFEYLLPDYFEFGCYGDFVYIGMSLNDIGYKTRFYDENKEKLQAYFKRLGFKQKVQEIIVVR